jgi:hypothetical protein
MEAASLRSAVEQDIADSPAGLSVKKQSGGLF